MLEAAVVIGAQAGQHGQLLPTESRNPAGPGERHHSGLGRGELIAPGPQKCAEGGAVAGHGSTLELGARGGVIPTLAYLVLPCLG